MVANCRECEASPEYDAADLWYIRSSSCVLFHFDNTSTPMISGVEVRRPDLRAWSSSFGISRSRSSSSSSSAYCCSISFSRNYPVPLNSTNLKSSIPISLFNLSGHARKLWNTLNTVNCFLPNYALDFLLLRGPKLDAAALHSILRSRYHCFSV